MGLILLFVLIVLIVATIPAWPYSRRWSYYPSGAIGVVLLILVLLIVTGQRC